MNQTILIGRIVKDPESKMTASDLMIASFTLAVNRMKKDEADFISCKAFGKTAELIGNYLKKGSQVGIVGRIQTGSYEAKDGTKRYTTDVIVNEVQFLDSKPKPNTEGFSDLTPVDDSDLPF